MIRTDSREVKKITSESQVININQLNDDCLIHIFENLSIKEKLTLEFVSRRFNAVSKLSWNHNTSLEVNKYFEKKFFCNDEKKNTNLIIQVIRRCGNYLNTLLIDGYKSNVNWPEAFKNTFKFLINVTKLEIKSIKHVLHEDFKILMKNNKNLKYVSLKNVKINFSGLMGLNLAKVETFILESCEFYSTERWSDFCSKLRSIKVLEIKNVLTNFDFTVDELFLGGIDELTEISFIIDSIDLISITNFIALCSRLKHLRKIECFLNYLHLFPNLKILSGMIDEFSDQILQKITKHKNLKELNLDIISYDLKSEEHFSQLKNIESFKIISDLDKIPLNSMLKALSKCEKLKQLSFQFKYSGEEVEKFETIFPNLKKIEIIKSNINSKALANIILAAPRLTHCKIEDCRYITNEFIDLVNKIKDNSSFSNVLNIDFYNTNVENNNSTYLSPLVSINIF